MEQRKKGLTSRGVLMGGLIFVYLGILSRALTRGILGDVTEAAASAAMETPGMAVIATLILVMEAFSVAAVPIFAMLIAESFGDGENFRKNIMGLGILALISEIPYNLVMLGKPFDMAQQNPIFGLLLCLAVIWVYNRFSGRGLVPVLIWTVTTIAAAMACIFLRIEFGLPLLLCTCVLWSFRNRPTSRMAAAVIAAALCVLLSPYYIAAPIGVILIHFYNGEHSEKRYLPCYVSYPAALLLGWIITLIL